MGALKWGLKATLSNFRTIVCNCAHLLGSDVGGADFSRISIFVPPDFFSRILSPDFFSSFLWGRRGGGTQVPRGYLQGEGGGLNIVF